MIKNDALIESKTLRESYMKHLNVLEKVKKLTLLPDNLNVTVEMSANYYEVHIDAIESVIRDNKEELMSDGLEVIKGERLSAFKAECQISSRASSLTIIPRRAILRIGMLLRDSQVARAVRDLLLNVEEVARVEQPQLIQKATNQLELDIKMKRADAMLKNATTKQATVVLQMLEKFSSDLSPVAKESLISVATNTLTGTYSAPLPNVQKTYTATEIAEELGTNKSVIGKLANNLGLKTPEYGIEVMDKSPYSSKQVTSFRYFESGRQALIQAYRKGE
ncbi:hypothetical protein NST83_01055 [Paenibacillus sp. FSL R10-2782]|uniref:hypothetical protein n=1 Tax=Paenibacillus sp. FSL R10-2782 TaxID=2954661 RepID=UPI00315813C7